MEIVSMERFFGIFFFFLTTCFSIKAQFIPVGSNLKHSANSTTLTIIPEGNSEGTHIASGQGLNLIFNDNNIGTDVFTIRGHGNAFNSSTEFLRINHLGNIGIGTPNPEALLHVQRDDQGAIFKSLRYNDIKPIFQVSEFDPNGGVVGQTWVGNHNRDLHIGAVFASSGTIDQTKDHLTITSLGYVGIGTTSPQSKLAVEGQIRAREVKVLVDIGTSPDYVFEPDYELRTLQETKEYISENKHLPEIPSASEMETKGVDLGDMNMRLLKKIEELTLYQIELLEKLEQQNEQLQEQQKRIDKLENK
ncbi:hypothetical protein [Marinoscillum sp.]|uniref:hypothetical protein n=1 Tax=Marinoscillum sp. TaxID=2024838 RepID=UPI003BAA4280